MRISDWSSDVCSSDLPASFIPLTTTAGTNAELGPKVVEGLLTYDNDLNPLPLLATEWKISEDGLRYTFTLRKGVKWHDGKDFTSADVAFSILTLKQVHPRGRAIRSEAHTSELQSLMRISYAVFCL